MLQARVISELTSSISLHGSVRPRFHHVAFCSTSPLYFCLRFASSSSRWKARQFKDRFTREAKVQGLKSRAAFKLLEMNQKYKLFKPGQTVVDLGYAPGSWSQVAIDRVSPGGRVVGIDIIPAQPPRGVSTIQGNFLSPDIQAEVRAYVLDRHRGRPRHHGSLMTTDTEMREGIDELAHETLALTEEELIELDRGYLDMERAAHLDSHSVATNKHGYPAGFDLSGQEELEIFKRTTVQERDEKAGRVVDIVLSDMSAPWEQTTGFWQRSISDPYRRMMNTTGNGFKDHIGSMDLCMAALTFCFSTLKTGGHFLCKYYSGGDDKALETRLKALFEKVHREKPDSSRKDSREAYFVGLRRKEAALEEDVTRSIG